MRHATVLPMAALAAALLSAVVACSDRPEPSALDGEPQPGIVVPPNVPPGPPRDAGKPVAVAFVAGGGNVSAGATSTLQVQVTDKKGNPVGGRSVSWSATNGGAFSPSESLTDASGYASTDFTAATSVGTVHDVTATTGTASATAAVTVVAGPAFRLAKVSGDGFTESAGATRTVSVVVTDQHGNPVTGHEVIWTVQVGNGSLLNELTLTGVDGIAANDWTVGTTADQLETARAASADVDGFALVGSPADFSLTTTAGDPARIEVFPIHTDIFGFPDNTTTFNALVFDAHDNQLDSEDVFVQWSTSDPTIVDIDSSGTATILDTICSPTLVTIFASSGIATGQATLSISPATCE